MNRYRAPILQHGERRSYGLGCRCPDCREANNAYHRDYYQRRKAQANRPDREIVR